MRGVADESPLGGDGIIEPQQQIVGMRDQRSNLGRHAGHIERLHIVDRTLAYIVGQAIDRSQAGVNAVYHQPRK